MLLFLFRPQKLFWISVRWSFYSVVVLSFEQAPVMKGKVDDSKWEGLEQLDVGSKFLMFEKAGEEKKAGGSDR